MYYNHTPHTRWPPCDRGPLPCTDLHLILLSPDSNKLHNNTHTGNPLFANYRNSAIDFLTLYILNIHCLLRWLFVECFPPSLTVLTYRVTRNLFSRESHAFAIVVNGLYFLHETMNVPDFLKMALGKMRNFDLVISTFFWYGAFFRSVLNNCVVQLPINISSLEYFFFVFFNTRKTSIILITKLFWTIKKTRCNYYHSTQLILIRKIESL